MKRIIFKAHKHPNLFAITPYFIIGRPTCNTHWWYFSIEFGWLMWKMGAMINLTKKQQNDN